MRSGQLRLFGMGIEDWAGNAGISNNDRFVALETTFAEGRSPAIINHNSLKIKRTSFADIQATRGAAILQEEGVSEISLSTFLRNRGVDGGVILQKQGEMTIYLSDFEQNYGGAIRNMGTIQVYFTQFEENEAAAYGGGAILNSGSLMLNNCYFRENTAGTGQGGAILNRGGHLEVIQSQFDGNTAFNGGAIHNLGDLFIAYSTFANNRILYQDGQGAAISNQAFQPDPAVFIINSTFDSNLHGSAIRLYEGNAAVYNSTFSGNTPHAIASGSGEITLSDTILANSEMSDIQGAVVSLGNNLVEDPGDTIGWYSSDIRGEDPRLKVLAYHGGSTDTLALQADSPAIGGGFCEPDMVDQRGGLRKVPCDIGAYESGVDADPNWLYAKSEAIAN